MRGEKRICSVLHVNCKDRKYGHDVLTSLVKRFDYIAKDTVNEELFMPVEKFVFFQQSIIHDRAGKMNS